MNHCNFRRAVDDQKSHTFGGQGYMAVGTEKGTGGPYFSKKTLFQWGVEGHTILSLQFPSASPQKISNIPTITTFYGPG